MIESRYHDGDYLKQNPTWDAEDSPWKAQKIRKILSANDIEPKTIAEIGCGAGEVLKELWKSYGGNVSCVGYEISEKAYQICSRKSEDNLTFRLEDLTEKQVIFDVLLSIDVYEHVPDYLEFLSKLKMLATYKVFHIPLDMTVSSVLRVSPILEARRKVGHLHYFNKETALASLEDTSHHVLDYFYTAGSIELYKSGLGRNLLHLSRKLAFLINQDFAARLLGGFSMMVLTE